MQLSYASKNRAFLIISYSLRFRALVGAEGRVVEHVDRAIISCYYIVYFFTDRDFDDIRLILVTRETAQPLGSPARCVFLNEVRAHPLLSLSSQACSTLRRPAHMFGTVSTGKNTIVILRGARSFITFSCLFYLAYNSGVRLLILSININCRPRVAAGLYPRALYILHLIMASNHSHPLY